RRAAAEVVALHDALEALAAADADDVDALAVLEHAADEHLIAGLEGIAPGDGLDLAAHPRRRHVAGLLVVPGQRLVDLRRLLLDARQPHRLVAVAPRVLRLQHHARPRLDDGRGRDGAVRREHLGLADF